MNEKQIAEAQKRLAAHTAAALDSPQAARAALIRAGIYQEDGKLSSAYRDRADD